MNHALTSFYPTLLATIDVAIGAGLLSLKGPSLLGLLMTVVGALIVCHILYDVAVRIDIGITPVT